MEAKKKTPTQAFNTTVQGRLIILNQHRYFTTVRARDITSFHQDSDKETKIVAKALESSWFNINFDLFIQAYINALYDDQIYDLRGICQLKDNDPAYQWYRDSNLQPEQMQELESRIRIMKPKPFNITP